MAKEVTVYTRTTCAYCGMVKKFLDMKQVSYNIVNLDEHPDAEPALIAKSGARTVPVVMVRDETGSEQVASIGWNPGALAAAIA